MADDPGKCCQNRVFDWVQAVSAFGAGLDQTFYPMAFPVSKFQFMLDRITPTTLGEVCLVFGGLRMIALAFNGSLGLFGVLVRIISGIGCAMISAQMGYSLYLTQAAIGGPPSPALPHYVALIFGEAYSAFRAGCDARFG